MKRFFLLSLSVALTIACAGAQDKAQAKLPSADLVITTEGGSKVKIHAELAKSEEQKATGLMFRKTLADGEGMLFVWQNDIILSFWMKNTIIPLSIAYIDREGVIREIYDMEPGRLKPVQSSRSLRYALEVPKGWFSRAGLAIGGKIDLTEVIK